MSSENVVVPADDPGEGLPAVAPAAGARRALRASMWMGSASVVSIGAGIIRTKVFAVLLGPAGIGIFGALQALQSLAISAAELGLAGAGARAIATARARGEPANDVQYVLVRLALLFGSAVAVALWLFREPLSSLALGGSQYASLIGVLGLGVLAAAIGGVTSAILTGGHRVGELARAKIFASVAATIAAILCVYVFREAGLSWALVSIPFFISFFTWMAARPLLVPPRGARAFWGRPEVRALLTFGGAAFGATVADMVVQVIVRAVLVRSYGLEAAGEYQAAWGISVAYCAVVLAGIPADYFPRASALATDRIRLGKAAVAQARMVMGLAGGPALLVLLLAPVVIQLVYTRDFTRAPEILQWQVVGDPLRIAWWILSSTLLAAGAVRQFLFAQVFWYASYLASLVILPNYMGLEGTGLAHPVSLVVAFPPMLRYATRVIPGRMVMRVMALPSAVFAWTAILALGLQTQPGGSVAPWVWVAAGLLYIGRHAYKTLTEDASTSTRRQLR